MTKELSKRQKRREKMRRAEQRSRLITIGLVTLGAVFIAFFFIYPNFKPVGDIATPDAIERPQTKANTVGDANAPVMIQEFADFQCPYCRLFFENTEAQLVQSYVATGKVYFVYHSFGDFIGPESRAAAEAAYCAGDQNKFWEMHDIIFTNQPDQENSGALSDRRLKAFAKQVGVNMGDFNACYGSGTYSNQVSQDFTQGRSYQVQATPSFVLTYVVNGETKTVLIEGAQPFSEFQKQIDTALAAIGS